MAVGPGFFIGMARGARINFTRTFLRQYIGMGWKPTAAVNFLQHGIGARLRRQLLFQMYHEEKGRLDQDATVQAAGGDEPLPDEIVRPVPFRLPDNYRYRVRIFGRDKATGRFTSTERWFYSNFRLRKGYIEESVMNADQAVFSEFDEKDYLSKDTEIFSAKVTAAERNESPWGEWEESSPQ